MADVVIEASSGGPATVSSTIRLARKRGTVVLCGEKHAPIADFDADAVVSRMLSVVGLRDHGYESVERALALIASRTLPLDAMRTDSFGLDDVDRAMRRLSGDAADRAATERLASVAHERGILVATLLLGPDRGTTSSLLAALRDAADMVMIVRDADDARAVIAALR